MDFLRHIYELSRQRSDGLPVDKTVPGSRCRPFRAALRDMAVIAEVKYATPAEGDLGVGLRPAELAREFSVLGASAVSCLTEPRYFAGSLDFIAEIKGACGLPVLMKDFIVDERQIYEGRRKGADAILLITEMLSDGELAGLLACGRALGMDCLVEVHGSRGLERAVGAGADLIGVNVRDLSSLEVIPERHGELAGLIPAGVVKVAESGISSRERLLELKSLGYDAALVGRAMARRETREGLFTCG
jgi:indole-3-glycerol phosphate synthase